MNWWVKLVDTVIEYETDADILTHVRENLFKDFLEILKHSFQNFKKIDVAIIPVYC